MQLFHLRGATLLFLVIAMGEVRCGEPGDVSARTDEGDTRFDSDLDTVGDAVNCVPATTACSRGVLATCNDEGTAWRYQACPSGMVCDGGECVPNFVHVVIATSPILPDVSLSLSALPGSLENEVVNALCDANTECCETFTATIADHNNASTLLAERYWTMRLAHDLTGGRQAVSLLGPPSGAGSITECGSESGILASQTCLAGTTGIASRQEFEAMALRLASAPSGSTPSGLPKWATANYEAVEELVRRSEKVVESVRDTFSHLVDGELTSPIGEGELELRATRGYPMTLVAFLFIAKRLRPEGESCTSHVDCRSIDYKCIDGVCTDPASRCRLYDIIYLTPFAEIPSMAAPNPVCDLGVGHGANYNVWSQWMRWGIGCSKASSCSAQSQCLEVCDVIGVGACDDKRTCVPDYLLPMDGLSETDIAWRVFGDYENYFPTERPEDAVGRRFTVRSHAIYLGTSPTDLWEYGIGPIEHATATALLGEGVAVTPCPPDVEADAQPNRNSSRQRCAYEAAYLELIRSIREHGALATCDPRTVGLPEFSETLIK